MMNKILYWNDFAHKNSRIRNYYNPLNDCLNKRNFTGINVILNYILNKEEDYI